MGEIERVHHIKSAYNVIQRVGERQHESRKQKPQKDAVELSSTSDEATEEVPQSNVLVEEPESHIDFEA